MSDKTEIAACPFCGVEGHTVHRDNCYFAVRQQMLAAPDGDISLAPELLAAWNRRATIQPAAAEPVGLVVADDPVHGWHMIALKPWDEIGANVKLYTAPVAPADAVRDAERWISVEERLPEPGTEVLINGSEGVEVARYAEAQEDQTDDMGRDAGWWGYKFAAAGRSFGAPSHQRPPQGQPTHWMPLPEAPDNGEE